jgi:hypothetical protein
LVPHLPGGPQDRAIAAEHQRKVGAGALAQIGFLQQIDLQHLSHFLQQRQPTFNFRRHAGPLRVAKNEKFHRRSPNWTRVWSALVV